MLPINFKITEIRRGVQTSTQLQKLAAHYTNDCEVVEKIATVIRNVNQSVFEMIKVAANPNWLSKLISGGPGSVALKTTAAALPIAGLTYATGAGILNKGRETAQETAEDIRENVLKGALGLGGLGVAAYGLGRIFGAPKDPRDWLPNKTASTKIVPADMLKEAVEKLATVGVIETLLTELISQSDAEMAKKACELQAINQSYGVHLLNKVFEYA